jgi:hypothetical protein
MKANLKKMLGMAALGMTLLATTVPTWAGYVDVDGPPEVYIHTIQGGIEVSGSMVGARYSPSSTQYIGCEVGSDLLVYCGARDGVGNYVSCISNDPRHVEEVQGMIDSSYIFFMVGVSNARCNRISIWNDSSKLK